MLEVRNIRVTYGAAPAVVDASLAVEAGGLIVVVGPNGAGKTTLINALAGLHPVAAGSISIHGRKLEGVPAHRYCEHGIALVPEGRRLFTGLTVRENLELGAYRAAARARRAESLAEVCSIFPVLEERLAAAAGTLSRGQQQMLAIRRALMARPKLLLLHQPPLRLAPAIVLQLFPGIPAVNAGGVAGGPAGEERPPATYLPDADKAKGYALLCQAKPLSDLTVEVREVHGVRPRIIPCRVERLEKPAPDVAILGLRLPMNENFRFLAGQYIDILLKEGRRRSYSLATKPEPGGVTALEIHVRQTPGGLFTEHVFSKLKVRDLLRFEGPLGSFYLREESDKPIVMVASGTGFAPIEAICKLALEKNLETKRPMTLYWG